ncbi:hypothetical protein D0962_14205 [Leptolyngbyaceae cyanobacterium CCMR0082]|uniref:Uncharacterized protein n=2 Tax=Adonisia turfae TaxID=2950184 RepID=A0A6M0S688_9CYAN|nr:hypothetical protein [Adonisia turfae]MDV3350139.1 hypothetical protein [Leptothoe sp. LEGE 181152]NEZ59572.1 hypothetical protein [Adonisia turfae CCMR0081]NEZ63925.1 hypothetical protein [Adonisia turfae CCMR0082]
MSHSVSELNPLIAQTPVAVAQPKNPWLYTSIGLAVLLLILGIVSQIQFSRVRKKLKFEAYKNKELQKRVKLALTTISKMEKNPDLVHSRDFNLDYLRMRMEEKQFHFSVLNQLKVKVKQRITVALRPQQAQQGVVGIASKPRAVDQIFDVEYQTVQDNQKKKRVLFRIQIKLVKLPTQATSITVQEIIDCIENFLSPDRDDKFWQPTLLGRLATMHWDQKAKPTPLLVLEQTSEGVNVTFRSSSNRVAL